MSNEFRPLIEILRELKALTLNKESGFLFIVTEEKPLLHCPHQQRADRRSGIPHAA